MRLRTTASEGKGAVTLWRRTAVAVATGLLCAVGGVGIAGAVPPSVPRVPKGGYQELWVPSSMGQVKVQVQWAARRGNASLYLLDGLRARNDRNAWTFETDALRLFKRDNITLVMPVGGQSSFYTDWYAPSNLNGQMVTYRWETFLTRELPNFLSRFGVVRSNTAIAGLSMGGTSALTLAAYHRDQFRFAGSFSGYLNITAPGMREAIRLAMLDAGLFNVDSMWGPPWSRAWMRNDPYIFAPKLRGLPMFISAGTGIPGQFDRLESAIGAYHTMNAMALESLAMVNTRAFEVRLMTLGIPAIYDYSYFATHSWGYWGSALEKARPIILDVMRAH